MRQVREILRQKWVLTRSHREVAKSLAVSPGAVAGTVRRAQAAGLDWAEVERLTEDGLEERLYGTRAGGPGGLRPWPDCEWIHAERRRPGVTLELLHIEYLERHPDGYRYSQFCEIYRRWLKRRGLSMRQVHVAGEKVFTDYSGKKPHIVDRATGERVEVELFVAALGASSYTYAEATRTQRVHDWVESHTHALEYFGGVPGAVVPDQLKSAVSEPCRYEPGIQHTFEDFARHYGTAVLPARPYRARDKAKVEVAVQVAQRWILARLRNETFFSLDELNARIRELLEDLNARRMRTYNASRRDLFERLDRPALKPLPSERFEPAEWRFGRVDRDYHVLVEHHVYSVPYALVDEQVEARVTGTTVEIFHRGQRVAVHARSHDWGGKTTQSEHMPASHRAHLEWTPSRIIEWATGVGPRTRELVEAILGDRPHPEMGYRSCLGILRLAKRYGHERLDAACGRALTVAARSYRHVEAILKNGLDRQPVTEPAPVPVVVHENIRGGDYYQ